MQEYDASKKKKAIRMIGVVLLTDLLLCFTDASSNSSGSMKGSKRSSLRRLVSSEEPEHVLIAKVSLVKARIDVARQLDCEEKGYFLVVTVRNDMYYLLAQTDAHREEWRAAIQTQIDQLVEAERFYEGKSYQGSL